MFHLRLYPTGYKYFSVGLYGPPISKRLAVMAYRFKRDGTKFKKWMEAHTSVMGRKL